MSRLLFDVAQTLHQAGEVGNYEAMEECFANCLGLTKIPLEYVIRKELAPNLLLAIVT
jgi:hypothetical protein